MVSPPSTPSLDAAGTVFRERLTVPWWTWLAALFWAATLGIAYGHALGLPVGIAVGVLAFALATTGLVQVSTVVRVDPSGLWVGPAHLPHTCIGRVEVLDADAARRRRGPEADPRAYTALRGWVRTAVALEVVDPRDPTPSWYVSTRRPQQLAAALQPSPAEPGRDRI